MVKNACLNPQQSAEINELFEEMSIGEEQWQRQPSYLKTTFSGLAGDPSLVCEDDVAAAIDYFEKREIHFFARWYGDSDRPNFSTRLKSLYYKEGGKIQKPDEKWYEGLFAREDDPKKLTKEKAAAILWKHVKGCASLSDVEWMRASELSPIRESAIAALREGSVAKGIEKMNDDQLCQLLVNAMAKKGECNPKSLEGLFGYYLAYLDAKGKYKDKVLSYVFNSPCDRSSSSELKEVLTLYGMRTKTGVMALHRKYPNVSLATWFGLRGAVDGIEDLYLGMLKSSKEADYAKEKAVRDFLGDYNGFQELVLEVVKYAEDKEFFVDYLARFNKDGKYDRAIAYAVIRYGLAKKYLKSLELDLATVEAIHKDVPKTPIKVWSHFNRTDGIDSFYRKLLDSPGYTNEEKYELVSMTGLGGELAKHALETHLDIFSPEDACKVLGYLMSKTPPTVDTIRKIGLKSGRPLESFGYIKAIPEELLIEFTLTGSEPFSRRLQFVLEHEWSDQFVQERMWSEITKGRSESEIFAAVAVSRLVSETAAAKKVAGLIKNLLVSAIKKRDGAAVNSLFGWVREGAHQVLADVISKECTPDEIVWLSDIQNASKFAEENLAPSLAEVYLGQGDFVKLFKISPNLRYYNNDEFWKRSFNAVIQHRDRPELAHILWLDVVLRHTRKDFWTVTNTERDKNISDATEMLTSHLNGKGTKFYYNTDSNTGWGFYGRLKMGEGLLRDAIGKVQKQDGDGVVLLSSVLEHYAHLVRNLSYYYYDTYEGNKEKQAMFSLMSEYLKTGLPALLTFDMSEKTRISLVESNAYILSVMLIYGEDADRKLATTKYRHMVVMLANPLCDAYKATDRRACYYDKGLGSLTQMLQEAPENALR